MSGYKQNTSQELEPLISIKQAMNEGLLPISKSNYYDGVAKGKYPEPIKIGRRRFYTPSMLQKIRE
jgi:predicted DNA-binding transcriptional regulator AlpA